MPTIEKVPVIHLNTAPVIVKTGSPLMPFSLRKTESSPPLPKPAIPLVYLYPLLDNLAIPTVSIDGMDVFTSIPEGMTEDDREIELRKFTENYKKLYSENPEQLYQAIYVFYHKSKYNHLTDPHRSNIPADMALSIDVLFLSWCCIQYAIEYKEPFCINLSKRTLDILGQLLDSSKVNNNYRHQVNALKKHLDSIDSLTKGIFTPDKFTLHITQQTDVLYSAALLWIKKIYEMSSASIEHLPVLGAARPAVTVR